MRNLMNVFYHFASDEAVLAHIFTREAKKLQSEGWLLVERYAVGDSLVVSVNAPAHWHLYLAKRYNVLVGHVNPRSLTLTSTMRESEQ